MPKRRIFPTINTRRLNVSKNTKKKATHFRF